MPDLAKSSFLFLVASYGETLVNPVWDAPKDEYDWGNPVERVRFLETILEDTENNSESFLKILRDSVRDLRQRYGLSSANPA